MPSMLTLLLTADLICRNGRKWSLLGSRKGKQYYLRLHLQMTTGHRWSAKLINYLSLWLILFHSSFIIVAGEKRENVLAFRAKQSSLVPKGLNTHRAPGADSSTLWECTNGIWSASWHVLTDHTYRYIASQHLSEPRLPARVIRNGLFVQIPP